MKINLQFSLLNIFIMTESIEINEKKFVFVIHVALYCFFNK